MPQPVDNHPVIDHALKIRQAMQQRDAALLNRLTREYLKAYRSIKNEIQTLLEALAMGPEKAELMRVAALRNLLDGVKAEIGKFAKILADELDAAILDEIHQAGLDSFGMVQSALPGLDLAEVGVGWSRLAPEQVYTMFGFTDPDGPLFAHIRNNFSQAVADQVRDKLLQGYIAGMHSTQIARLIAEATGQGLTWALSVARTATVWSYRAAQQQIYMRNSHLVRAWIWWSARNERTCMGCVSKHGSVHPVHEILADHHLGRCTALPVTATYAELGIDGVDEEPLNVESGEKWFKGLSGEVQKKMMGPAKWRAWKDGAFTFEQLSVPYTDPVYGKMWREASLKEMLGDKATLFYET